MKKHHRRKTQFVDAEVQGALARRISIHWMLFTLLAATLIIGLRWLSDPFTPLSEHLSEAWSLYGPMLLVLVCLAPVFVYDAIKLSNRFTGPIMRLRNATRMLAAGSRPAKICLRKKDFWKDLADDFNLMVERYEGELEPANDSQPTP